MMQASIRREGARETSINPPQVTVYELANKAKIVVHFVRKVALTRSWEVVVRHKDGGRFFRRNTVLDFIHNLLDLFDLSFELGDWFVFFTDLLVPNSFGRSRVKTLGAPETPTHKSILVIPTH